MKKIRTKREINNDILEAELAGNVAFGIGKPGDRSTPFGCLDNRRARSNDFQRCAVVLDICQESEKRD